MKAACLVQYGRVESVVIREIEKPSAVQGKILVQVHAAGVNPIDWKIRSGYIKMALPITLGGDFAGTIVETGPGVYGFKAGEEVFGQAAVFNGATGSFAEFDLVAPITMAHKPKRLSMPKAAAIPLTGVSALQALVETMQLKGGQKILIHGGAGGIGSMAIQMAKHIGAHVATTVSEMDFDYVRSLGANDIIDYRSQRFEDLISKYDAVLDNVGGDTYRKSFKVLKQGGILVSMLEPPNEELSKAFGVHAVGQLTQVTTDRLTHLAKIIDAADFKIHIEKTFKLDQADEALSYLEDKHSRGKVVITM